MKSIIQDEYDIGCYLCGCMRGLETHHVWHGTGNRKKADEDGLTVLLCPQCHRNLHDKGINDKNLMAVGEKAWIRYYGKTTEDFIERYGKNVL